MTSQTIKTRGRPRTRERGPGLRPQLAFAVTHDLMEKIAEARRQSGRSQSAECEYRLERSFDRQSLLKEVLELSFGKQIAQSLMSIGSVIQQSDEGTAPALVEGRITPNNPMSRSFRISVSFPQPTPKKEANK
jgi:hypothetical protein